MASYTTNLNLIKPADSDSYDVANDNSNMDKIDAFAGTTNTAIANMTPGVIENVTVDSAHQVDLNDIKKNAFIYTIESTKAYLSNGPDSTLSGNYFVTSEGSRTMQLFCNSDKTYIRTRGGSNWGSWLELVSNKNALGSGVDLSSYTSGNRYSCPSDGYVQVRNSSGVSGEARISGATGSAVMRLGSVPGNFVVFVRKGMRVYMETAASTAYFFPLE